MERRGSEGTPGLLTLDGAYGEGGGQILRTALSLAVALRRSVALTRIRTGRPKPGLQPQHLTVVRALAAISDAKVAGDALGSTELSFTPRTLQGGSYRFDVGAIKGSAGAVSLLFQALLLPLAFAPTPSRLTLIGGTHVPWSPPVHYLTEVFLPALGRIGVEAQLALHRWGWYPAGGGEVEGRIIPTRELQGFRPEVHQVHTSITGLSAVSRLPRSIAERQRRRAEERLSAARVVARISVQEDTTARSPGTLLFLAKPGRAGFPALGRRGVTAEQVADEAVEGLLAYLASGAAVDDHLADQLVPFLALGREGSEFTCPTLSPHLRTVAWVVQQFLPVRIELADAYPARVRIIPGGSAPAEARRT
ncbi:MAG: RNA 3'-phosphate cyclase [Deltaproteobacteria bacterium]|nr:RNA 3'-phosphate cyclase [Deltaproteobacteria bacterium]MBI3078817.1 RNA 3'-phosphate cyclase [Deltaproteobacteria bacterium]